MSVTIRLADDLDVSRGDMICRPNNQPQVAQDIDAMVCWMDETSRCSRGAKYADQAHHPLRPAPWSRTCTTGSTSTRCTATSRPTRWRSTRSAGSGCAPPQPLFVDDYRRNRITGGFILIDEATNRTVGAGMIVEAG